jgi:hypothetical protein
MVGRRRRLTRCLHPPQNSNKGPLRRSFSFQEIIFMTDTTNAAPAPVPATDTVLQAVEAPLAPEIAAAERAWLRLHDDWAWIISHAWSVRFMFLAFLLSGVEAGLTIFASKPPINPIVFASLTAIISGAAFVARLVAQKRAGVPTDGE